MVTNSMELMVKRMRLMYKIWMIEKHIQRVEMYRNGGKMKKVIIAINLILLLALLSGCNKEDKGSKDITDTASPSPQLATTLPIKEKEDESLKLQDFYPFKADIEYVYQGDGNEYASYLRYTDFLDTDNQRIQTRTSNGGTETVRVLEIRDGTLSVISRIDECYYRDYILDKEAKVEEAEVLLMEPLVQGTEWTLPDGRKRYISGTDVEVETPLGSYKALEVTTEDTESILKDYYAYQIGLVKSIYASEGLEVSSMLSEINKDKPFTKVIEINHPDADGKIYVEPVALTFHTGDDTRTIIQEALQAEPKKASYLPLISANTKINSLYLGDDNIVYVDFTSDLAKDMNAGASYEALILQGITNTLGNYYGVMKVNITINNKPYEGGHIRLQEKETFMVNMDEVVRE